MIFPQAQRVFMFKKCKGRTDSRENNIGEQELVGLKLCFETPNQLEGTRPMV